jgi:hypothetical protein
MIRHDSQKDRLVNRSASLYQIANLAFTIQAATIEYELFTDQDEAKHG